VDEGRALMARAERALRDRFSDRLTLKYSILYRRGRARRAPTGSHV
jgi:hypothetical protein